MPVSNSLTAERIIKNAQEAMDRKDDWSKIADNARFMVECHIRDILTVVKNINETSLSLKDKEARFAALEKELGMPARTLSQYFL